MRHLADISQFESVCGVQSQGAVSDVSVFNLDLNSPDAVVDPDYIYGEPMYPECPERGDGYAQVVRYVNKLDPSDCAYQVILTHSPTLLNFAELDPGFDFYTKTDVFDNEDMAKQSALEWTAKVRACWERQFQRLAEEERIWG